MISHRLLRVVQQNADRLTNDMIAEIRRDPRASAYHELSEEDLHERALDLFHNLGQWLSARTEFAVQTRYQAFGRKRYQEKIPFSQALFALTTAKSLLLNFIRGAIAADSPAELPLEHELVISISQFFDKALYHAAAGYEDAARAAQAPSHFPEAVPARANNASARPVARESRSEGHDLGLEVSRSGDIGESAG
jgi:hypothetical protein